MECGRGAASCCQHIHWHTFSCLLNPFSRKLFWVSICCILLAPEGPWYKVTSIFLNAPRKRPSQRERVFLVKRLLGWLIFLLPVCMEICHGLWEFCGLGSRCLHIPKMCNRKCFCSRATREFLCNWELLLHIWGLSFCSIPFYLIHELQTGCLDTTFYFDIVAAQFILQTEQLSTQIRSWGNWSTHNIFLCAPVL